MSTGMDPTSSYVMACPLSVSAIYAEGAHQVCVIEQENEWHLVSKRECMYQGYLRRSNHHRNHATAIVETINVPDGPIATSPCVPEYVIPPEGTE
jgi:hypothetical protein